MTNFMDLMIFTVPLKKVGQNAQKGASVNPVISNGLQLEY